VKTFNVVAVDHPSMKFNPKAPESIEVDFERKIQISNPDAKIYVLEEEVSKVAAGVQPMPLTLRANVGDCIKVNLKNKMKEGRASFSAIVCPTRRSSRQRRTIRGSDDRAGREPDLHYYATCSREALASGIGNVMTNPRNGLFGSHTGPKGAKYRVRIGEDIQKNSWSRT
jgi:hypothetical protein